MTPHPSVVSRYRQLLQLHRCILPPGELTAERHLQALDPCGLLSLGEELGAERVAGVLREALEVSQ